MTELLRLARKAKAYYPNSKFMRRQWIEKTTYLLLTGKHVCLSGTYPNKL